MNHQDSLSSLPQTDFSADISNRGTIMTEHPNKYIQNPECRSISQKQLAIKPINCAPPVCIGRNAAQLQPGYIPVLMIFPRGAVHD